MKINSEYFEYSDAWLFTSLFMYDDDFKKIKLTNIIAFGDALNHSIFNLKELQSGFSKLQKVDLIKIQNDSIKLTETGLKIKENVANDKGGFFQKIDNTLKRIRKITRTNNSKLSQNLKLEFLNDMEFELAYENYKKR